MQNRFFLYYEFWQISQEVLYRYSYIITIFTSKSVNLSLENEKWKIKPTSRSNFQIVLQQAIKKIVQIYQEIRIIDKIIFHSNSNWNRFWIILQLQTADISGWKDIHSLSIIVKFIFSKVTFAHLGKYILQNNSTIVYSILVFWISAEFLSIYTSF